MIDFEKIKKKAEYLTDDAHGGGYGDYWEKFDKEGIRARKLEFLQTYDFIDGNEDYDNKNYDGFVKYLKEFHEGAWGGKDNITRIHYVEKPVNEYLKMEYYTYLVTASYGQDIRITYDRSLFPKKVYDFVLFENGHLFLLDFGNNDTWNGAWHITDKKILKEVADWYDEVFAKCKNFKSMIRPNKELVGKMKDAGIM